MALEDLGQGIQDGLKVFFGGIVLFGALTIGVDHASSSQNSTSLNSC